MTAQNSAAKNGAFYKFLPYYLNKLRYLRPQFIMSCILSLLTYPVVGALLYPMCSLQNEIDQQRALNLYDDQLLRQLSQKMNTMSSLFVSAVVIGIMCLVGLFVFTFVTTLRSYRYLYDKTYVDMDMSLPVNHNTRFFGDLAATATTNLLPHFVAILIGVIMLSTCGLESLIAEHFSEKAMYDTVYTLVTQCMFTGLYSCIMQIGLCLLMLSFCGRKAEAYIYPILVNIAIPIIHGLAYQLAMSGVYGSEFYAGIFDFSGSYSIAFTSPLGMLFMTAYSGIASVQVAGGGEPVNMPMFTPTYAVPALILTIVFFAGAYFLIKFRRSERVGMSYVYKGMDLIIPGVLVFALVLPFSSYVFRRMRGDQIDNVFYSYTPSLLSFIIWPVVLSFIAYIIMALISGRNFRKFHITLAKWAGTLAVSVGISAILAFSNGFGMTYYVPNENNVAFVRLEATPESGDGSISVGYNAGSSDLALIREALEIHRDIPKYDQQGAENTISLIYLMKNGETLGRVYTVTDEQYERYMKRLCTPELWVKSLLSDEMIQNQDKWTVDSVIYRGNGYYGGYDQDSPSCGGFALSELVGAIKADCQNVSYDMLNDPAGIYQFVLYVETKYGNAETAERNGEYSTYVTIYSWMDNTLSLLKDKGLDVMNESVLGRYETAFIVKGGDNRSYDMNTLFAYSENVDADEFNEIANEIQGEYTHEDVNSFVPDVTFGCAKRGDDGLDKLVSVSTDSLNSFTEYYLFLTTAKSLRDKLENNPDYMVVNIPDEYSGLAEQMLQKYLVYTVNDPLPDRNYTQEVA